MTARTSDPSRTGPQTLPRGLGGAQNDQELRNVRLFKERFIDDGSLPEDAREALLAEIDSNRRGFWVHDPREIRTVRATDQQISIVKGASCHCCDLAGTCRIQHISIWLAIRLKRA